MSEVRYDAAEDARGARGPLSRSGRGSRARLLGVSLEERDCYEPSSRLRQRTQEEARPSRS